MILLTRPQAESEALANFFPEDACIIAPMMEIAPVEFTLPEGEFVTIATSKNVNYPADIKIPEQGKTAEEILQYCLGNLNPKAGKLVYLSGSDVTLDIAKKLKQRGFNAERIIAYEQVPASKTKIDFTKITVATFFSLNTLRTFSKNYASEELSKIICVCISEKLGEFAANMDWLEVNVASEPNLSGMIDAIGQAAFYRHDY